MTYSRREFIKLALSLAATAAIPTTIEALLPDSGPTKPGSFDLGKIKGLDFTHIPRFEDAETVLYRLNDRERTIEVGISWNSDNADPLADLETVASYFCKNAGIDSRFYRRTIIGQPAHERYQRAYGENYGKGWVAVFLGKGEYKFL